MANDHVRNLIEQARETPFYKEVLIPELNRRLALYDELIGDPDPWKRYGYVEAYFAIKSFKLSLETSSSEEEAEIKQPPVFGGTAK